MAEYRIIYTSDGKVRHELDYKGHTFGYSMVPDEYGKTSDKQVFEYQVAEKLPGEDEETMEAIEELTYVDEEEIEDILCLLESNEWKSTI